jgi:hypothetical protein
LVHQLRHDFLSDGLQWERVLDYHFFVLYLIGRMVWIAQRLGIDLWDRLWPPTTGPEATVEPGMMLENHADYDASGDKRLFDYFLAPLYMAHSDGSFACIGDGNEPRQIYELAAWGPFYETAWAHSGDERFAWLLTQQYAARQREQSLEYVPRGSGQSYFLPYNYVYIEKAELPAGRFDLTQDTKLCQTGRHENGCTLFPATGNAVLRANAADPLANNLTFVYGPHHAGHQHPDLLSFVWQVNGQTALLDTAHYGTNYNPALHGAWDKQTVAHNTVLMDGVSQRPQGDSDYEWMTHIFADVPRGELLAFHTSGVLKAVAAQTTNAYDAPATLRRALLMTPEYVLDQFVCAGAEEHRWDYALHPTAPIESTLPLLPASEPLDEKHGLKLARNVCGAALPPEGTPLRWGDFAGWLWCSGSAQLHTGETPSPSTTPGVVMLLTQRGRAVEYRGVFSRRADAVQVEPAGATLRISGAGFADTVRFAADSIAWTREGEKAEAVTLDLRVM